MFRLQKIFILTQKNARFFVRALSKNNDLLQKKILSNDFLQGHCQIFVAGYACERAEQIACF